MSDEQPRGITQGMSSVDLLGYLGTDAHRWAYAFVERFTVTARDDEFMPPDPVGLMIGWFACAIEAGRDAGRAERQAKDAVT